MMSNRSVFKNYIISVSESLDTGLHAKSQSLSSCLTSSRIGSSTSRDKKQVSFILEKENKDTIYAELNSSPQRSDRHHQLAEHTRNIMDINKRLSLVRSRSNEFKSIPDFHYKGRQLLGYR
jgi:hypothetical protein